MVLNELGNFFSRVKIRKMDSYLSLFLVSFLAATLFPAGSEILLLGLASAGHDPRMLWLWATLGNTLGSMVNYGLGRYLLHFQDRRWFPVKPEALAKTQQWFQRYGTWSLLLSWAPIFGDALTLAAGVMRVKFVWFVILVVTGKGVRYAILLGLMGWFGWT
jgi:membrane protein YqaA with SNARE-associated domain